MSTPIKTPELPESVDEATLLTWHAEAGEAVKRDQKLADVETDKIVLELFAPVAGVLSQKVEEGGTLRRGDVVAEILEGEGAAPAAAAAPAASASEDTASATPAADSTPAAPQAAAEVMENTKGLSPSVRKLIQEHHLDPNQIQGSGRDGRITRQDVLQYMEETPVAKRNLGLGQTERAINVTPPPQQPAATSTKEDPDYVRRVPMSQLRKRVASRLKEVQNTAALLSTFNEVNMKPVMDIRSTYKARFEKEYGVRLGFMSFFVKATVEALKKFPIVNAQLDGNDILYQEAYHIGVAVDSPRGLVVPVLRNAEDMSFAEVEQGIRDLAGKAKEAKLAYEDLVGGTFTITNGGVFGSMLSTPIINAPQSGILGMHSIQQRPWVEDGEVVVRPVMNLALTYDHRIIDGRDAVQFLGSIKESLEDPAQLMLQL